MWGTVTIGLQLPVRLLLSRRTKVTESVCGHGHLYPAPRVDNATNAGRMTRLYDTLKLDDQYESIGHLISRCCSIHIIKSVIIIDLIVSVLAFGIASNSPRGYRNCPSRYNTVEIGVSRPVDPISESRPGLFRGRETRICSTHEHCSPTETRTFCVTHLQLQKLRAAHCGRRDPGTDRWIPLH